MLAQPASAWLRAVQEAEKLRILALQMQWEYEHHYPDVPRALLVYPNNNHWAWLEKELKKKIAEKIAQVRQSSEWNREVSNAVELADRAERKARQLVAEAIAQGEIDAQDNLRRIEQVSHQELQSVQDEVRMALSQVEGEIREMVRHAEYLAQQADSTYRLSVGALEPVRQLAVAMQIAGASRSRIVPFILPGHLALPSR